MPKTHLWTTALLTATLATGCTQERFEEGPTQPEPSTLEQDLEAGRTFDVLTTAEAEDSDAVLEAHGIWLDPAETFVLAVEGGAASVQIEDGQLMLNELTIELADLDHEMPGGSHISDLSLVLENPVTLTSDWSDATVTAGATDLAFRLDWSISNDDTTLPLSSQSVESVGITIHIDATTDNITLQADIDEEDDVFELPGMFTVERFDATVLAN